jgi:hypothetical protein
MSHHSLSRDKQYVIEDIVGYSESLENFEKAFRDHKKNHKDGTYEGKACHMEDEYREMIADIRDTLDNLYQQKIELELTNG